MSTDILMNADDDTALIAERIKQARTDAGLSRPALEKLTGIPARTIERLETATQQVTVHRLKLIATATDKPLGWLQGVSDLGEEEETETHPGVSYRQTRRPPTSAQAPSASDVLSLLDDIDAMRDDQFEGMIRRAMAAAEHAGRMLAFQEPVALIDIAMARGIDRASLPKARELQERLETSHNTGIADCRGVEERILDTALIGTDLHAVPIKTLKRIAEREDIASDDGWLGWSSDDAVYEAIRSTARAMALTDQLPDELKELAE